MYLCKRNLNTIENVIDMPEYNIQSYEGFTFSGGLTGIMPLIPIFVVYQNKKDMNDVLVGIHVEVANTHEQIVLSMEFLTKFFSDTYFSEHLVEKNGRMFVSEFRIPNLRHSKSSSLYDVENSLACEAISMYGVELAIAITHKSVDDIKKAKRVRELLGVVNEFKTKIRPDSTENMIIREAEENIKSLRKDIEYWDIRINKCHIEVEADKAIFEKYDINWKNFIKE